ncbi:MAG: FkbM family methyltransferase [Ferruginibacter sp.]
MKQIKALLYSILEMLTRGRGIAKHINGADLRLPAKYFRYFPSNYEADNFEFLKASVKPGSVVLDIGAHIGLFSVIAAKYMQQKGKVFAFEPTQNTYLLLEQTIAMNVLHEVIFPVKEAMSKETGTITFYVSENEADNSNSLISYKQDRQLEGIEVSVDTIDNFASEQGLRAIDFIKIDVEGAEFDTLRGGTTIFKTHRPHCILAIHPEPIAKKGDQLADIYDYIQQLKYSIIFNGQPISKSDFCANTALIDLHLYPL